MKTLLGLMLALTSMLSVQAAEEARIDVSGNLIAPPCTPRFAASQQVTLGQANSWEVDDEPLELTLQVKPVSLGELPEAGSYSAMLLMQLIYR